MAKKLPHPNYTTRSIISGNRKSTMLAGKISLTGDDILMEYMQRLIDILTNIRDNLMKVSWSKPLKKFCAHYIWHSTEDDETVLHVKL
jgi:hypothetical protein